MSTIPETQIDAIEWFETRNADWINNADTIGLTEDAAQEVKAATEAARAAYDAAEAATAMARNATEIKRQAIESMRVIGGGALAQIRAYAKATSDDAVYTRSMVPPPATPSASPAPSAPSDLRGALNTDGSIEVTWAGKRAGGTMFFINRQVEVSPGSLGPWEPLAATAETTFTDDTLPVGVCAVNYQIQAQRSGKVSAWSPALNVRFSTQSEASDASDGYADPDLRFAA